MKALRIDDYGGSQGLEIVDVARPALGSSDVLVEVHAASVNPIDWKIREGHMKSFVEIPMPHIMGRDVSGESWFALSESCRRLHARVSGAPFR